MLSRLSNLSIGVVGANGFIGSAVLRSLLEIGVNPRALCGPVETKPESAAPVDAVTCDLADVKEFGEWFSGLDVVVHVAGPPSVSRSFQRAEEYIRVHVLGTAAILGACRAAHVSHFVYISSAEVYGRPEANPVIETHRLQARSPYAAAKIGAEKLIEANVEAFGIQASILRPFSIYGSDPHPDSLLFQVISSAKAGRIRVRDLRPIRDYCYVDDLASAILLACCSESKGLNTFNIGSGRGTSVADFAKLVAQAMSLDVPILENRVEARPGQSDIMELISDSTKAHDQLGWVPQISLSEGVRLVVSKGRLNL